jgi:hypothetical protein
MGFLGPRESLAAVIARDTRTLQELGLTHRQLADALAEVLQAALAERDRLLALAPSAYRERDVGIPDLYHPASVPVYARDHLPDAYTGYVLEDDLQVFVVQYRGMQECPWGCAYDPWSSFDFMIVDRRSGASITGPGMGVHQIRAHHFFEGVQSPYRMDPAQLARVLRLT